MKKNYLLTLILVFGIAQMATSQTYGVFADSTATDDAFVIDNATGHLYIWNNLEAYTAPTYEGSDVLAFEAQTDAWFGFGIASDNAVDLSAYSEGYLNFAIKIPASNTTDFDVLLGETQGNEARVTLTSGDEPYGMKRDGNWHFISIPVQDFMADSSLDMSSLENIFAITSRGTTSGAKFVFDEVCFSTSVPANVPLHGETASSGN